MKTLIQFIKEKVDMTKPGWMLKADPELAKKIQAKKDLEKKRQDSYGDPYKGISVRKEENDLDENTLDKIKQQGLWKMITHHETQAKKTKSNIKKDHHLKMADKLRSQLKTNQDI
jgi:hypothetical protein